MRLNLQGLLLKFSMLYALVILFFPEAFYVPSVAVLSALNALHGSSIGNGEIALSYFAPLPLLGAFWYLLLPKDGKYRLRTIVMGGSFVEFSGLLLLGVWYVAQLLDMGANSETSPQVVTPTVNAPLTSIGLWFAGISLGLLIPAVCSMPFARKGAPQ